MTTKHTPGPWVVDRNPDQRTGTHIRASVPTYSGAKVGVSVARVTIGGGVADDSGANAALIAAAPDLLDALAKLIKRVEFHAPSMAKVGLLNDARAAIAKAEGSTP